jgi:tRNA threonylcarbamoyl adenosine modification protein YjeE
MSGRGAAAQTTPVSSVHEGVDEQRLELWGEQVGRLAQTPLFIALRGDLGAGKSVLARAIARGAGVEAVMPSPTYNLLYRYDAAEGRTLVHMDLYRLEREAEVWELGWRELGTAGELALVEWPERAQSLLPPDRWDILLEVTAPELRRIRLTPHGDVPALPTLHEDHADRV